MNSGNTDTLAEKLQSTTVEDKLRQELEQALVKYNGKKTATVLEPTYKKWLFHGVLTPRRPVLVKGKLTRKIGSRLRQRVQAFQQQMQGKDPLDCLHSRKKMPSDDEEKMRAAFTLREAKDHEQAALLDATLAALPRRNGMDEKSRRRYLEGMAIGLQQSQQHDIESQRQDAKEAVRKQITKTTTATAAATNSRKRKAADTPQQKMHKLIQPIFQKLWDTEFPYLGNTNPFRIVIDRDNCAAVGAPDYFEYINEPMNLTYIQQKIKTYESFASFRADMDLLISNALTYNSDPQNPYHMAAQDLQKKYKKLVAHVLKAIQQRKEQRKQK